jgi:hypothetical protein
MESDSEAGDHQDGDNRYPENEVKFHNPSLRVLRASGIPVRWCAVVVQVKRHSANVNRPADVSG